jgi:hypothetical protein
VGVSFVDVFQFSTQRGIMNSPIFSINDAEKHGIPMTRKAINWVAYHREYNGAPIFKVGGKCYTDRDAFIAWMRTNPRVSPPGIKAPRKKQSVGTEASAS